MISSSKVPLHVQLADLLRSQIHAGEFGPGDQLPTEKELMQRHGMSSSTVRQAVLALVQEGLLYRRAGKGTFVSRPTVERDLLTFSGFSEEAAAKGFRPSSRLVTARWTLPPAFVAKALDIPSGSDVFEIERVRIADDLIVALETVYFVRSVGEHLQRFDLARSSLTTILEEQLGIELERAHQIVRAASASSRVAQLLEVRPRAALLQIERTAFVQGDRPCYVSIAYYRPDRYSYEGWIERQRRLVRSDLPALVGSPLRREP